jgi:hypothetical protein
MGFLRFNGAGPFSGNPYMEYFIRKRLALIPEYPLADRLAVFGDCRSNTNEVSEALRGKELIKVFAPRPLALQRA